MQLWVQLGPNGRVLTLCMARKCLENIGRDGLIWLKRALLYQLSYAPHLFKFSISRLPTPPCATASARLCAELSPSNRFGEPYGAECLRIKGPPCERRPRVQHFRQLFYLNTIIPNSPAKLLSGPAAKNNWLTPPFDPVPSPKSIPQSWSMTIRFPCVSFTLPTNFPVFGS